MKGKGLMESKLIHDAEQTVETVVDQPYVLSVKDPEEQEKSPTPAFIT